ncbi:MAG: hypothetical protein EHM72_13035 [Calditrichaeota bacterium]|nr:MAG: hypothetical protein EHM72_13035 [Calditrichota bacterium]
MRLIKVSWLFVLITTLIMMSGCNEDHGIQPLPGNLAVDVIFINNKIPTDTQGIYLFVAPTFPPHAINEMFLSPNSLPFKQLLQNAAEGVRDTIYTEMNLPYGHYEALGLWWYNKKTESNLADVFTLKIGQDLMPVQFDITPEKPFVHTDLWANLTRVERDAAIEGTISFNGPFPENTLATAVAAYFRKPTKKVEYLVYLISMDFSIDENPYHFVLPVSSRYKKLDYLAVFWLSERSGLDDFRTIGFYRDPTNPEQPGIVKIKPNETTTGCDIQADWSLAGE